MNIQQLSDALNAIADEVTDDSKTRLASVDRRVQLVKRGKVAATVVTTCAAVLALVFVPNWAQLTASDPTPAAAKSFGSLATVKQGGVVAYRDAAGVRLLKAKSAPVGTDSLSVSVTPKTTNLGWTQPCRTPATGHLQYHLAVNGTPVPSAVLESLRYTGAAQLSRSNVTCDEPHAPMQVQRILSLSPDGNQAAWKHFRVQTNVPATFTLSVTAADDAEGRQALASVKLQLGVFEVPRHPVLAHGVWIARHIVDPPGASGAFELVRRKFQTIGAGHTPLTVPTGPGAHKQLYVRTFLIHGQGSAATLQPGPTTPYQLRLASTGPWDVEKLLSAGVTKVPAAVAVAPTGAEGRVAMLVYRREG